MLFNNIFIMKAIQKNIIFLSLLLIFSMAFSQKEIRYMRAKVFCNESELQRMVVIGIDIDHLSEMTKEYIIGEFSDWEMAQIRALSLKTQILIDDMVAYYQDRNLQSNHAHKSTTVVPNGFNYGSMGGFLTMNQVEQELDSLFLQYPNLFSQKISIGNSYENRPIWMIKMSDNPDIDENEPEALYVGLHHAREAITIAELLYFMQYLAEKYGTDPEITYLLQNRELYFVPVLNPDGYVYNEIQNPLGGGMWRKNRHVTSDSTVGIDLNRNYGFEWAFDDLGSNPLKNAETYRGDAPFSEPETQVIRAFCQSRQFKTALNGHSYSNRLLYPWGHQPLTCPDDALFTLQAGLMTQYNAYTSGQPPIILYAVNGDSNDWMYGEQTEKGKIMAMTPETGTQSDGFWPIQARILPLCEEMLPVLLDNAWFAGEYVLSRPPVGFSTPLLTFNLPVETTNYGQNVANNVSLSFVTNDMYVMAAGVTDVDNLPSAATQTYNIMLSLSLATPTNQVINGYIRTSFSDGYYIDSAVSFTYTGAPVGIADEFEFSYSFLYPNPTNGKCYVKLEKEPTHDVYIEIWDTQNKFVKKHKIVSREVDLSPIADGMYFYRFSSENKLGRVQKLWVE